jgi:hypothetical protein
MPKESASPERGGTQPRGRRRFKPRELSLADGSTLSLKADGSIDRVADDGITTRSWAPDDADWPRQAIRFGVRPAGTPVTPPGRQRWPVRPPGQ